MNGIEKLINKMIKKSEVILNAGKQTNEEWMKSLNTEDFAEAIFVFMNGVSKQINGEEITNKDVIINEVIIKWLKGKHDEMWECCLYR